jgi:hypothetical protein
MILSLTPHIPMRDAMEFLVYDWCQLLQRRYIPLAPRPEQLSDIVVLAGHPAFHDSICSVDYNAVPNESLAA